MKAKVTCTMQIPSLLLTATFKLMINY